MSKSILQIIQSCFVQKTAPKDAKQSGNESIFKIGHHAKAIAHAKSSRWVKKLKFQKTCQNPFYKSFTVVLCKKPLEKTPNIREMRLCCKSAITQRLQPIQNPHFGSKIKIPKNMSKSILQIIQSCSVQKTARKNTKYSRNETILKIGHHAKARAHGKCSVWVKNKNSKKHVKIHSTNHLELFCAKNCSKNTKQSRNESILKIGHHAKAIATLIITLSQKLKFQKTCQNPFYKSFKVFVCKKTARKNTKY